MNIVKVKISEIKLNESNPRFIKDDKFKKLVKSIKDLPQMLDIRPIVVNKDMMVLGGNMRLKACVEAGLVEVPIIIADNLTKEQEKEFLIKDNVGFGEWDWDIIANEFNDEQVIEWGLDIPNFDNNEGEDIEIEQSLQIMPKNEYVIIFANSESEEWEEIKTLFKCKTVRQGGCTIGSTSDKATTGLERVFDLKTFKERLGI
jgi:hypothetical protein